MQERLNRQFYDLPTLDLARALLGTTLVTRSPEGTTAGIIVETEAYIGPDDRASHARGGLRSARTEVQYGPPGTAYVFRVYGVHRCFCIVSGPEGSPEVVLIRALEPSHGVQTMQARRHVAARRDLCRGPAKLCQALAIGDAHYGVDLTRCDGLYVVAAAPHDRDRVAAQSPRIRIDYSGPDALLPWRFFDPNSAYVSS